MAGGRRESGTDCRESARAGLNSLPFLVDLGNELRREVRDDRGSLVHRRWRRGTIMKVSKIPDDRTEDKETRLTSRESEVGELGVEIGGFDILHLLSKDGS